MEKPQGWSSLTRLHNRNNTSSAAAVEAFPSLGENSGVAVRRGAVAGAVVQAPFVSVVSKGLVNEEGVTTSTPEDAVVARLREQHGWADNVLLRDILHAVDGDEAMASQQLDAMATPGIPPASDSDRIRPAGAAECEENDVYLKFRREALRLSRARGKYARGAYNAYLAGDHAHAKQFSREARENFKTAEQLHAQAAEEILFSRNADVNVWALDLHGLHATEAVHALKERLAHLEKELAANPNFLYDHSQRMQGVGNEQPLPLAASRTVLKNELSVITGTNLANQDLER
jgi:hypothetical protein